MSMIVKSFQTVRGAEHAKCFNCSGELVDVLKTDYAPSRGQWRGWCKACRMFTWFDVAEPEHCMKSAGCTQLMDECLCECEGCKNG